MQQRSRRPLTIEFFGLPGVGKTPIAVAAIPVLRKLGYEAADIRDRSLPPFSLRGRVASFATTSEVRSLLLASARTESRPFTTEGFRRWSHAYRRMVHARQETGVTILHEALIQELWRTAVLAQKPLTADHFAHILTDLPLSDIVGDCDRVSSDGASPPTA